MIEGTSAFSSLNNVRSCDEICSPPSIFTGACSRRHKNEDDGRMSKHLTVQRYGLWVLFVRHRVVGLKPRAG